MTDRFVDRVAHLLMSRKGRWVEVHQIAAVGGFASWRSRISDARRVFGLTIENRLRRVKVRGRRVVISEYRVR